jgi:HNH endonuclease
MGSSYRRGGVSNNLWTCRPRGRVRCRCLPAEGIKMDLRAQIDRAIKKMNRCHRKPNMTSEEIHEWVISQINKIENGCWLWTRSKNSDGYGNFKLNGKAVKVHKYMLEYTLGRTLLKGMSTCHSCHNRACCNPDHLREGTHSENMKDMVDAKRAIGFKGEQNHSSKLTEDQVRQIRQLNKTMTNSELSKMFNISRSTINFINTRASWKHVV